VIAAKPRNFIPSAIEVGLANEQGVSSRLHIATGAVES
jgi:hypothetical protein